jgi:hypothetical protein
MVALAAGSVMSAAIDARTKPQITRLDLPRM